MPSPATSAGSIACGLAPLPEVSPWQRGGGALAGRGRCELCGQEARLSCTRGCCSYYCDENHQKADWLSIHQQICQLLPAVRSSLPCHLSEEQRKHALEQLGKRKKYIIQLASSRAQQLVWDGHHKEAIPAALHALRFSAEVYSSNSLQLVPAYLLLAEAYMGVCDLQQASKYLSQAQWIVLMTPDCSGALQSQLYHSLGLLSAAEGNLEQALCHLANDIYLASSTFGLQSIETSGGYFHMANIFFHQKKMDVANSLYAKVTSIWHDFLVRSLQAQEKTPKSRPEMSPFTKDKEVGTESMTAVQQAEGIRVLNRVLNIREQAPVQKPEETARVLHALTMLYYLTTDLPKAHEVGMKALDLIKQLPQQDSREAIDHLLKLVNSRLSSTK